MNENLTCCLLMKGGVAVLAGLLISACTQPTTTSQSKDKDPKQVLEDAVPGSTTGSGRPEVAFMIEEGLYAVPLAVDKDGCEQFTTWSETGVKSLAQPIYFHDGEGAFSPIKVDDASCNASMIKTGVDEDGCPTFRAEQPDGSSSEVVYYPSHHGYTIRKERSNCR